MSGIHKMSSGEVILYFGGEFIESLILETITSPNRVSQC